MPLAVVLSESGGDTGVVFCWLGHCLGGVVDCQCAGWVLAVVVCADRVPVVSLVCAGRVVLLCAGRVVPRHGCVCVCVCVQAWWWSRCAGRVVCLKLTVQAGC